MVRPQLTPETALELAFDLRGAGCGREQALEAIIAQDYATACVYATEVLHSRFVPGEAAILRHGDASVLLDYVMNAVKGPWPEAETAIASDPRYASRYAVFVIRTHEDAERFDEVRKWSTCD